MEIYAKVSRPCRFSGDGEYDCCVLPRDGYFVDINVCGALIVSMLRKSISVVLTVTGFEDDYGILGVSRRYHGNTIHDSYHCVMLRLTILHS
jgi:hypothetical protein